MCHQLKMKDNIEQNHLSDLAINESSRDTPELTACLEKYSPFEFLSPANKVLLAQNELTFYDQKCLQSQSKLSEFVFKQISIRSSLIMTLWFSLFDFVSLGHHLFESIDKAYIHQLDQKL